LRKECGVSGYIGAGDENKELKAQLDTENTNISVISNKDISKEAICLK